jgi:uncharacterized protein (TIGR02271 family)
MDESARVFTKDGDQGRLLDPLTQDSTNRVRVALDSGRVVRVSPSALRGRSPDSYWLDVLDLEGIEEEEVPQSQADTAAEDTVVPVLAEEAQIGAQPVITGGVRVRRSVHEYDQDLTVPLKKEQIEVKRVSIEREVEGPLPIRTEANVTIIPIVEEEVVISKRFILREEVHIIKTTHEELHHDRVSLKRHEPAIERIHADGTSEAIDLPPRS